MNRCDRCGQIILFGGIREGNRRFCGKRCRQERVLVAVPIGEQITKQIPHEKRLRRALIALALTLSLTGWAVWAFYDVGLISLVIFILPISLMGLALSFQLWRTTEVKEVSREAAGRRDKWYVDYPLAGLFLCVAVYEALFDVTEPNRWGIAAVAALIAAMLAPAVPLALLAVVLAVGWLYLMFKGIASLPVNVAIIIAAIIIARAIIIRRRSG